ncbi:MAG: hypothetical protein M5U32_18415 [Myxococcota bacterium]|nr:hypothetical protein [Myxococcota bacterium]
MKTYQNFATTLEQLLAGDAAVRIHVEGYMPLVIERIGDSGDGRPMIALSHTAVQNGDLMRDPELVFEIFEHPASDAGGARRMTRAAWSKKPQDYRSMIDDVPHLLELDASTGATVLAPVTIVDRSAEPITFRNDFVGVLQDVYDYDEHGRRARFRPALKRELKSFARTWFRNLKAQGFLGLEARREVLA